MFKRSIFAFLISVFLAFYSGAPIVKAAVPVYPSGMLAVHRFYNVKTLTHFYTPDEAEVTRIKQTLPDFRYEGIKFNAYSYPAENRVAVYRFYNIKTLTHFYTSDENEVSVVRATLPDFQYEGPSYYAEINGDAIGCTDPAILNK